MKRLAAALLAAGLAAPLAAEPTLRLKLAESPGDAPVAAPSGHAAASGNLPWTCGAPPEASALMLSSALQAVVCHSAGWRQGEGLAQQARAALQRAQAQAEPSLSLSGGWDASRGSGSDVSLLLRLDWVWLDFGSRDAALRQARHALSGTLAEQGAQALEALANAAQLYTAAQSARGRLDAAAHNLRSAEDSERISSARHGAGAATLTEKLQAQTASAQAALDHSRAQGQWLASRGELALAMGLAATAPLALPPDEADDRSGDAAPDFQALLDEARELHPRVQAARARLAEARERAAAANAQRWGEVALGARAGRSRASSDTQIRSQAAASLEWNLPLLDRGAHQARLLDAQGLQQQRGVALDEARRVVEQQVWQQGQLLLAEQQALQHGLRLRDSAEQALRAASERYRQGVGSFADLLSAQNQAASARLQLAESRSALRRARWRLAAALGRLGPL